MEADERTYLIKMDEIGIVGYSDNSLKEITLTKKQHIGSVFLISRATRKGFARFISELLDDDQIEVGLFTDKIEKKPSLLVIKNITQSKTYFLAGCVPTEVNNWVNAETILTPKKNMLG